METLLSQNIYIGCFTKTLSFLNKPVNQDTSATVDVMLLNSASAEFLEIVSCFFAFHEIKEVPNLIMYFVIDFRACGHVAQS